MDLSNNGIGLKGITALCEALKYNELLHTLKLDTNSIGDEGVDVLAKFMASEPSWQCPTCGLPHAVPTSIHEHAFQ